MRIGIPKEVRAHEGRVALIPEHCRQLVEAGHEVFIEGGAGSVSGYSDGAYQKAGVRLVDNARRIYTENNLVIKVKEPSLDEISWLQSGQTLFCYLHLAAAIHLVKPLLASGVCALGFEIVEKDGVLPLLEPMSRIAGRLAGHIGINLLHGYAGGRGILLGGIDNTDPGKVMVLGAGNAGAATVDVLQCTGAKVHLLDINQKKLHAVKRRYHDVVVHHAVESTDLVHHLQDCDLLVGAVLSKGQRAPVVVNRDMVKCLPPGSVIVDIAIDQGGCIETSRPTDYRNPTYVDEGVLHFCVTNMPGAVSRTATQALSAVIWPYVERLASGGILNNPDLYGAIYLQEGEIKYAPLSESIDA